ncbi:MAG: type II toxin-antitoxin system RelE/ParE family toxin [Colwellia sp.]|nr:type II toxin-antitoxin system RelE/ParE family toxin [Colwellia sp.]
MNINFAESAIIDLENIKAYYQEQLVPHIGEKFVIDILAHIETLPTNPEIGRLVPEFNTTHIRELIHAPYRVVYTLDSSTIQIIRIWRSERLLILKAN